MDLSQFVTLGLALVAAELGLAITVGKLLARHAPPVPVPATPGAEGARR